MLIVPVLPNLALSACPGIPCAALMYCFSVARQYADQGVTCNGIAPCYVFSPMIMEQLSAEKRAELLDMIPVKKFCTPEEVAHTTNFLVSPLAGFITGEIIDQNGGFQMD